MNQNQMLRRPFFDPQFGKEFPLNLQDKWLIRRRKLYPFLFPGKFKNIITVSPYCDNPFGMREFYLMNTDPHHDYRVTLKMSWQQGLDEGEIFVTLVSKAGTKTGLGCESSATFPSLHRVWEVVAETVISTCWV